MITWMQLWWELLIPTIITGLLTTLPTIHWKDGMIGGGPIREWLLNHCLLPLVPHHAAEMLVQWWMTASTLQEVSLSVLIAINLNVLLLPVLYLSGEAQIRYRAWAASTSLKVLRQSIRR